MTICGGGIIIILKSSTPDASVETKRVESTSEIANPFRARFCILMSGFLQWKPVGRCDDGCRSLGSLSLGSVSG